VTVSQTIVPGLQTFTLTQGLLMYGDEVAAQREPFTVMGTTLLSAAALPPVAVRYVEPVIFPDLAVISVVPDALAVARPLDPVALLTIATSGTEEVQVTEDVKGVGLPYVGVPVAENCSVEPTAMLEIAGSTSSEKSTAGVPISKVESEMPPDETKIVVVVVLAIDVAMPVALSILTAPVSEVLQVIPDVKRLDVPSE
jgi:hypothetical protein